jgi:hypothetical protein
MKKSSDYLPMFSGYLPISNMESTDNLPIFSANLPMPAAKLSRRSIANRQS